MEKRENSSLIKEHAFIHIFHSELYSERKLQHSADNKKSSQNNFIAYVQQGSWQKSCWRTWEKKDVLLTLFSQESIFIIAGA